MLSLDLEPTFTPYVGVAPGTTTMQINGQSSFGCATPLGCPPGYYGQAVMLPGSAPAPRNDGNVAPIAWNPYASEAKLRGLRGAMTIRWDLLALAFGVAFAGYLGFRLLRKGK